MHFRIEVDGVEAHASTRYLSVHAGGRGRRRRERGREAAEDHRGAPGARAGVGEHEVASDPAAGLRHALARDHRRRPGRRQRRPADAVLERRHDAELLLGRVQPLVLSGRDARGRAGRGRGRRRRRLRASTRGCASIRRGSRGSSAASTSRRSTCRSTTPPSGRSPAASTASGSIRRRRGSAPRPISRGTGSAACRASSAAPAGSLSATSPTSTSRPSSSLSLPRSTRCSSPTGARSRRTARSPAPVGAPPGRGSTGNARPGCPFPARPAIV